MAFRPLVCHVGRLRGFRRESGLADRATACLAKALFLTSALVGLDAALEKLNRLRWITGVRDLELLAALLVVGYEEFFNLRQKGLAHIGNGVKIFVLVGMNRSPKKPAVLFCLAILRLLGIYDADDPNVDQTPDVSGRIHQNHNVKGIAIISHSRWNEPEIEWEHHPLGQQTSQHKQIRLRIVIKFVAGAFRRFDDRPASSFCGIELIRKGGKVSHGNVIIPIFLAIVALSKDAGRRADTAGVRPDVQVRRCGSDGARAQARPWQAAACDAGVAEAGRELGGDFELPNGGDWNRGTAKTTLNTPRKSRSVRGSGVGETRFTRGLC